MSSDKKETPSEDFNKRLKDVFAFEEVKIKASTSRIVEDEDVNDVSERDVGKSESGTSSFKGRESLYRVPDNQWDKPNRKGGMSRANDWNNSEFKKPDEPKDKFAMFRNRKSGGNFRKPHQGRTPDFRKNPEKYTKYTLEDTDVMSNKSNTQAAFSFLRALDERKRSLEESEEDKEKLETGKIVFKKPTKRPKCDDSKESASMSSNDEKKEKKKPEAKKGRTMLSHLMDDDEEEED